MAYPPDSVQLGDPRPNAIPIERRIALRREIAIAREYRESSTVIDLDELEVLLRCYEHGRFQT